MNLLRWNDARLDSFYRDFEKLEEQVDKVDDRSRHNAGKIEDMKSDKNIKMQWWLLAATWASPIATVAIILIDKKG